VLPPAALAVPLAAVVAAIALCCAGVVAATMALDRVGYKREATAHPVTRHPSRMGTPNRANTRPV
jgi:hypothetical protein